MTQPVEIPNPGPLTTQRDWVSLEHDGDTYLFDLTFLQSNWTCIFGAGCKGVLAEDATDLNQGCCSHGAHFADPADRKRVLKHAARLTPAQWQFAEVAEGLGGPLKRQSKGSWMTAVHDGACIFLNRNDFAAGPGCALHVGAVEAGESFLDWKPEVCWQLPLRLSNHVDDVGHTTWTLTDWKRRDWGEGGEEFHWWCTESDDAFVGHVTVLEGLAEEITALVGEQVFEKLVELFTDRWTPVAAPVLRNSRD